MKLSRPGFFRALFIFSVMLLNPFFGHGAEPDFAFPGKVEKTAGADLKAALKTGDGKGAVNAMIRLGLAKAQVNTDSLQVVLGQVAELAAHEDDPAAKALLDALSAKIYTQIYTSDRWTYDRRETVANPGDDYRLWSSRQFLDKVMSLTQSSLAAADELRKLPLKDYVGIVEVSDRDLRFYPTLFDFIAVSGINNLDVFASGKGMRVLNSKLMENPCDPTLRPGPTCRPLGMILGIYTALIDAHKDQTAPRFVEEIAVREFVNRYMFSANRPQPRGFGVRASSKVPSAFTREMLRLYDLNRDEELAGLFLDKAADGFAAGEDAKRVYPLLVEYRKHYPAGILVNDITNAINRLGMPSASFDMPSQVSPDKLVPLTVNSVNGRSVKLEMFDVTARGGIEADDNWVRGTNLGKAIETKTLEFDRELPFSASAKTEITFPGYGMYVIRMSVDGKYDSGSLRVVRCSDLSLSTLTVGESSSAWVVDAISGKPVKDAEIYFRPWSRRNQAAPFEGKTDADGEKALAIKEYGLLSVTKGSDRYAPGVSASTPYETGDGKHLNIELFTSLGLYRPGDEVEFALVAYTLSAANRVIAAGRRVGVELRDANFQPVDTIYVTTDSWGRAEGKFTLPTAGLTGGFQLRAGDAPGAKRVIDFCGSRSFMVSDYKLPTFEVKTLAVNRPVSVADSASVTGEAVAYSGFPIAEAQVKASLKVQQGFWWWKTESQVFYTGETVTAQDGKFTVVIPASAIAASPAPDGIFVCDIEVTSPDGETRTMTACFNMGKPLGIVASIPAQINLAAPFNATVEARDANGDIKPLALRYKVTRDSAVVAEGEVGPRPVADIIRSLPTGSYSMVFAPVDTAMAQPSAPCQMVLYRPADAICPVGQALWMPDGKVTADADGKYKLILGSDCGDVHVRMIASAYPGKVIGKRWLTLKKGMQEIEDALPAGVESARVLFECVRNFESFRYETEVKASASRQSIAIEIETFRDKVTPGQEEKITFRVKPSDKATAQSAMFLDMSNKAIDVLASNPLSLTSFNPGGWTMLSNGWNFSTMSTSVSKDFRYKDGYLISVPTFQLYGMSFTGGGLRNIRIRGAKSVMFKSTSRDMTEEVAMDEMAVEQEATPLMAAGAAVTADNGASADDIEAVAEHKGEAAGANDESYRPSEIPLAFFRPMLTTAEDGSLEISYTVPDANTTWILRAMAYNKELLTASTSAEIVSSKPVMVSQNAPRFLRTADSVVLASSVMNNTDSLRRINVVSEVVSASSGKVLLREEKAVELDGKASAVASVEVVAPTGETGLIYRVRAVSGDYADGEQTLLPVLPSEQDVVESEMFYIAPDDASFSINLPAMSGDERAYLNFTENPSWQVVSALPGLREGKINSSVEAAAALFSAAVADGILHDNPELARVLRRWAETGDSALVSNLEKNHELKTMLLNATPWVSEALSDTERMQRLSLLFDKRQTRKVISDAIDRLAQMRADGGWSWSDRYPAVSRWATEVILDELGDLNRMGWLPADQRLSKMIKESLAYLDRETAADFKKFPKGDYWLYVTIRDKFPQVKPSTAASRVIESEVQKAVAGWKDAGVPMKGVYALILNNHGYNATARQVLQSLREYATSTPEKGMWWQQLDRYVTLWSFDRVGITSLLLDAFDAVEPGCDDVEKIRQWLILNKTNNDWGNAVMTTQAVASILSSGKPLKINTRGTAIHIGDTLLQPQSEEYATGAFTEQITSMLPVPATMTIDRQADYPSVGGVVMMRRLPMDSIKAVGCQEISVGKSLMIALGDEWVPATAFKIGDRVRVELTLRVEDDLSYVVIEDLRAAGLEPVEQLPAPIFSEGLCFYRENRDSQTNIFIDFLPRGTYRLAYELFASQAGSFASGVAQVQSQYNPIVSAHSAGATLKISGER